MVLENKDMKKNLNNLNIVHGQVIEDNDELSSLFEKSKEKTSKAAEIKNLESLSIEQLKEIAEDLGLLANDNKPLLIKAIKKEYKKR